MVNSGALFAPFERPIREMGGSLYRPENLDMLSSNPDGECAGVDHRRSTYALGMSKAYLTVKLIG